MKKKLNKEIIPMSSNVSRKETEATVNPTSIQDNLLKEENLDGYPHYPAGEDIMNPKNSMEQLELSEEKFSQPLASTAKKESAPKTEVNKLSETDDDLEDDDEEDEDLDEEEEIADGEDNETNITDDDLIALDHDSLNLPEGDDAPLRKRPVSDMSGIDLDIPGSELDDEEELIGSEDEENNAYSIGGDRHDDLEENGTDEEEEKI